MKYYIYISDAKVDMLFPQVPSEIKQKIAKEYKLDLKLFSAIRKTETVPQDNRIHRLEAVVDYISEHEDVGTADHPNSYFEDTLLMRWGHFSIDYDDDFKRKRDDLEQTVLFTGEIKDGVIGLGGSMSHVLGQSGKSDIHVYTSALLLSYISNLLRRDNVSENDINDETHFHYIYRACEAHKGPQQRLEFFAKRLADGLVKPLDDTLPATRVLIGTPLYVALAE